jgi:hypothetical protein
MYKKKKKKKSEMQSLIWTVIIYLKVVKTSDYLG